jgi:hypothetical protein
LWYDEVTSVEVAQSGPAAILANRFGWLGNQTPGYYLVLWLLTLMGDPSQTAVFVRLPGVLAGTLAVPMLYLLGRDTLGRPTGLLAAAMLALSFPALNYSQDVRQYSVMVLLTLVAFYSLIRIRLGGWGPWWAAFAAATIANVLYSYLAITVVLPSLSVLALWVLLYRWRHRAEIPFTWAPPLVSAAATGLVAAYSGLQALGIPGGSIDLSRIGNADIAFRSIGDWLWFLRFGASAETSVRVAVYLLPLAIIGLGAGARTGSAARVVAQSALALALLSEIELLVLATSKVVLPRYVLYLLPLALLFTAHGAITLARLISALPGRRWPALPKLAFAVAVVLVVVLFGFGAVNYYNRDKFVSKNTRPEFKGAASYLREIAQPGDVIVMICDPPHASTVLNFYWKGTPPAPAFDGLDPSLYSQPPPRRLLIVIGGGAGELSDAYFQRENTGIAYTYEMSTMVITLEGGGRSMRELMGGLVEHLARAIPERRLVLDLQGTLYQAAGETAQAAERYAKSKLTDTYISLWREYLATADGFERLGNTKRAWLEVVIAKFESSSEPEVHRQMARALESSGLHELAEEEERVAVALDAITAGATIKD